jgi:hypothetical protein
MVKSINGIEQTDLTSDGLRRVLSILQDLGITKGEIDDATESIKKKSSRNLKSSFLSNLKERMLSTIQR